MRFIDFFDQGASRNPDAPCFIHDETEQMFTFRHLREITLRTANALRSIKRWSTDSVHCDR